MPEIELNQIGMTLRHGYVVVEKSLSIPTLRKYHDFLPNVLILLNNPYEAIVDFLRYPG